MITISLWPIQRIIFVLLFAFTVVFDYWHYDWGEGGLLVFVGIFRSIRINRTRHWRLLLVLHTARYSITSIMWDSRLFLRTICTHSLVWCRPTFYCLFFSFCGAPARPGLHFHMVLLPGRAGPAFQSNRGKSRIVFLSLFFFPFLEKKIIWLWIIFLCAYCAIGHAWAVGRRQEQSAVAAHAHLWWCQRNEN